MKMMLWDVFHANIEDRAFCDEIDRHIDHIGHVHFADNNRSFPGLENSMKILSTSLSKNQFGGFVSFECLNAPDADTVQEVHEGLFTGSTRMPVHRETKIS